MSQPGVFEYLQVAVQRYLKSEEGQSLKDNPVDLSAGLARALQPLWQENASRVQEESERNQKLRIVEFVAGL